MSTEEKKKLSITRRKFLHDTAVGLAVFSSASALAACQSTATETELPAAPVATEAQPPATEAAAVAPTTAPTEAAQVSATDWLGAAPEIAESDIVETVETDVVVIGAGTAGQYVAASCLEKGLKVVMIEKNAAFSTLRNDWGSIGSKWQKEEGVELDPAAILHYHAMYSANRIDERLPKIWAKESGAAVTWIGELLESKGATFDYEGGYEPDFGSTTYPKFPTGHSAFFPEGVDGASIMKAYIEELGGEIRFETPFVKFEHEDKKVTAAIAQTADGKYIRLVGAKGIVLAAGGYQGNPAMLKALQPADVMIMMPPMDGPNAGDGIKACLWMGAAMDECHASMLFDRMGLLPNETPATMTVPGFFWLGSQPWLKVNLLGERFTNESGPYDFILHAAARQPGATYCCIFDANWFDQVTQFSTVGCSRIYPFPNGSPNDVFKTGGLESTGTDLAVIKEEWIAILQGLMDSGHLQQADTPEELAEKLNIPAETFAATFARYNELAATGVDEDFYKDAYRFLPVNTPPYYGIRTTGWLLSTLDGIRIDTQMRPLDDMNQPFEGLHVVGDASGSYFAHTYPNLCTGYANGRTITFSRRIARILAGEPVELEA